MSHEQPPFYPLIQGGNSPLYGRIVEQLVRTVDEEVERIWVTDGCSPTTPTALVRDDWTGIGGNLGSNWYDISPSLPCVSRYTLDMSGWEIKTDLVTNKKYIDVYICLEDFHVILGLSSLVADDGQTYWITKSVQITGDRIIFYKSKGIDADQTSLFQSQLGTIYNRDLPGNSVNCKDPPPDWNPSYYMYRPDQPLVPVEDQEEFWKYQCGCVNYLKRDPSNPNPGGGYRYPSVITPIVVKDRLISLSNIINEQQHPILNYTSNTSAPESIILDTNCVINASCGSASQLISFDEVNDFDPVSAPYNAMREIINSKNLDDFIQPKDSKLKALNFRVTEDDADFNSGTRIGNNTLTGPYIYFIILPNCGYKEWEDTSIDGVDYWGQFARSYTGNQGWGSKIHGGFGRGQFTLNIGCTPRAALPCNFTDQECDLCVRAAPSTWDYKNYDRFGRDCLDNPQPVYPTLDCNEGNWQWINDLGYATFPSYGDLLLGYENWAQSFQAECNGDEERDCHGNCFPKSWLNDNFCHNGKFRHPQRCKNFNDHEEGECELFYTYGSAKTEIYSVPEIFLNCPRFENQTKNCSWNDNTAPICKGVCCEVYQGVFTGACTIKSRNECVLYDSISHPKAFDFRWSYGHDWGGSDIKEEIWTLNTLRGEYSTIVGPSGELNPYVRNNRNVAIDIEGGYFWEISPKDTIASPTTCSVCSKVKGLSTGCVYFGCCEEGSAGVSFCSPSPLLLNNYYYEFPTSLYYQNQNQWINPNRSRPTNHGWYKFTYQGSFHHAMDTTTWFNFDYSVVNYYNEVLLKTKSNGWWEGIVQPVKQELPHTTTGNQVSRIGPDYTQNNMGTRACCINGECSLKTISDCKEAGGFFHINLNVCDNIYCEPNRIGRCCETFEGVATGNCLLVTKTDCEGVGGKNWVIDNLGNPIQCTNTYRGSFPASLGVPPAGTTFDLEVPILHGCIGNIPCVKMERDVRACCLEGGRCATLLISHCKNLGGIPDMLRYSCQQPHPLKESTPTDIKILNCAFAETFPIPMSGGATPAHQKYWCDPSCIEPICVYNKTFPFGTITGEKCCDDWVNSLGSGTPLGCDCILDDLNLHKVCGNERGCGDINTRGGLKYSGDCWTAHASPGCKNPICSDFICYGELTSDTYTHCCVNTWTEECAALARSFCTLTNDDPWNGCYAWQY